MGSFKWLVYVFPEGAEVAEEQWIDIVFSLVRNGRWLDPNDEGYQDAVVFDYLDHEDIVIGLADLDIDDNEYDRDVWNMLLQVTGLDAS